jgi:hypothetical protein
MSVAGRPGARTRVATGMACRFPGASVYPVRRSRVRPARKAVGWGLFTADHWKPGPEGCAGRLSVSGLGCVDATANRDQWAGFH